MKTKQTKEESDKSVDEETVSEPKTRARKKATDITEEEKTKPQDEAKSSKEPKRTIGKPKAVVKKKPLGIRKTLRSKKIIAAKDKLKNAIKQNRKRGRKPLPKPETSPDKGSVPLIPASEIKKEPVEETACNSRSSSPKTAGRRSRLSSDIVMMKSVLSDSPTSLVHGSRTSPYSMRSERSNSPSMPEAKNLRSGKPRKVKNNLLNEVVLKQQKKRRRLMSDSKVIDSPEDADEKKLKRGRSCSRDGSEISKCSDITESDISLSETLSNDAEIKELNKKVDKSKTDLDVHIENNLQISTTEKVPFLNDSKTEKKQKSGSSSILNVKNQKKQSLKRSTSIDSDNNNSSNRLLLERFNNALDLEDKANLLMTTENDTLFNDRNIILTSMSKTFNSKTLSLNIRKARKGRKAAAAPRPAPSSTVTNSPEEKIETIDSLSKEIDDLISNLDVNIDNENQMQSASEVSTENTSTDPMTKPVSKFYGLSKPLSDNNSIVSPDTPLKEKEIVLETTPSKNDDSENIRLHYEEDSVEKADNTGKSEITYKCSTVASIDKLMDRLKEFEELDKKRKRQESEQSEKLVVTNDVVLIPKSGEIKILDIQSVRSQEKPVEKENVLSCFENNSAISIVKRDHQARKSIDIELPNSVTLIKRNSISRKESTSSNHSRESTDAISIFEKSLGKDVTLTEIRKSVDKGQSTPVDLLHFASLHPTTPNQNLVVLDTNQVSITARTVETKTNDVKKRLSIESLSRKSSESDMDMATIEKIKSPVPIKSPSILSPVAIKSPEVKFMEAEPLAAPVEPIKATPEEFTAVTEPIEIESTKVAAESIVNKIESTKVTAESIVNEMELASEDSITTTTESILDPIITTTSSTPTVAKKVKTTESEIVSEKLIENVENKIEKTENKPETKAEVTSVGESKNNVEPQVEEAQPKETPKVVDSKPEKVKSARNSIENKPGPSNFLHESAESQKRKENVLRTLGLLTHKAANEAKIEKAKEKERLYGGIIKNKSKTGDYTGTLKTVIKLNRGTGEREKKKYRSSLKMTFQKSKNRSGKPSLEQGEADEDEAYYTIERREGGANVTAEGGHRKSHYSNRLGNHDTEAAEAVADPKETVNLVIPEKASSFSIHPGRLCKDQCLYCGGKFGLFDTPCHIAQMKSLERQKKVLSYEEKLTIDSCLCDACYRHVDRRANCPSYRKRPLAKQLPSSAQPRNQQSEKPMSPPPEEESDSGSPSPDLNNRSATCHTEGCQNIAENCIRRKWLIKLRSSVNKILKLEGDYPGLHTIPLCGDHYRALAPLMACFLCKRKITKHHNVHFIHHGYAELNPILKDSAIPVQFTERPVLCKPCRLYCIVIQKPGQPDPDAIGYRKRLLQIHNVEIPPESENETEDQNLSDDSLLKKKKNKNKSKRKSTEPEKSEEHAETPEETNRKVSESSETEKSKEAEKQHQHMVEDIENLISTNKIMVPMSKSAESDASDTENIENMEGPIIPADKQAEMIYLLQQQNNPRAQYQSLANLTQKQKHLLKLQNSGIQKPSQQQKINDKNAKRIQKMGQIITQKEKTDKKETDEADKSMEIIKNITLNDECTIESISNRKSTDISMLKNKWQLSESFNQVQKNLSQLSKKLTIEPDPKKISDQKYSNPVKRLETNPSISVRELFPGEEEMNLQCNIEFNNVKGVTPEGWEKCNSTIQYDVETKKLWTELQRPYGNQSSFLRHLILLEKYFRSGDLVLSQNAANPAASYGESVQNRLRAFDNIPEQKKPESVSLIEFRKHKPSMNGKSLLKTSHIEKDASKKSMPPPELPKKVKEKKSKPLPPELIAINTPNSQGRKGIQNVLHNIQQLVKGVSASDPTEVASAPLPIPIAPKPDTPKEKNIPKLDVPKKQKTTKPWRPTLMPITAENLARISREPTQKAFDGRSLPSLVQVMSSGKRYHITLQDYNKMCIMRREKLQQLQDGDKKKMPESEMLVTEIHPSSILGNGATIKQNITIEKTKETDKDQIGNAATILKNVGLKNITIAPIPAKPATITSQSINPISTCSSPNISNPSISSPSLLTSTPIKIPQLSSSISITSETIITPNISLPLPTQMSPMIMPKIPKSLTVIPQTVFPSQASMNNGIQPQTEQKP